MAIKHSYKQVRSARKEAQDKADDLKMINPASPKRELGLPYDKKSSDPEAQESPQPKSGTFDRNTMNPYEQEEYPRGGAFPGENQLRSLENAT